MNDENKAELTSTLKVRLLKISLMFLAVALPVFVIVYVAWGIETACVALAAALSCGLGAVLAHVCSELPRGDMLIMVRLMSSSMVRVGVPLILLLVAKLAFTELFDRGMVYFVILFYVVGLLTDVKLQMKRYKPVNSVPGSPVSKQVMSSPAGGDS